MKQLMGMLTGFGLALGACGDSEPGTTDTTTVAETTAAETTTATETTVAETTAVETTVAETTAVETTTVTDTTVTDTGSETEVADDTCGCGGGATCLQAKTAQACVQLSTSCSGGLAKVDACATTDVAATCEHDTTIHYHYFARIAGWLQDAKDACLQAIGGTAGTFTVTPIPEAVGDVCSCQRTAAACTQTYGDACATLTCTAPEGLQSAACKDTSRVAGRCVTQDGQRELFFYSPGTNAEGAEAACIGASAADYYWYPAGL